jgi:hypothetical protein
MREKLLCGSSKGKLKNECSACRFSKEEQIMHIRVAKGSNKFDFVNIFWNPV